MKRGIALALGAFALLPVLSFASFWLDWIGGSRLTLVTVGVAILFWTALIISIRRLESVADSLALCLAAIIAHAWAAGTILISRLSLNGGTLPEAEARNLLLTALVPPLVLAAFVGILPIARYRLLVPIGLVFGTLTACIVVSLA